MYHMTYLKCQYNSIRKVLGEAYKLFLKQGSQDPHIQGTVFFEWTKSSPFTEEVGQDYPTTKLAQRLCYNISPNPCHLNLEN